MYNLNDDEIIYEKDINEIKKIASLTKIMTCIVAIENSDLDSYVTVTSKAFVGLNGYAQAGFKVGDKVTIRDLLYGLMLPSGAETANMLAISIAGSNDELVKMMNDKAKELNLNNTHFSNTIGVDEDDNYSTVYDLAILLNGLDFVYRLEGKLNKKYDLY